MKDTFRILIIVSLSAILMVIVFFTVRKNKDNRSGVISPNILFLTSPVMSFSGTVDQITGNTLFVSQSAYIQPPNTNSPAVADVKSTPIPTPSAKKITYKVLVDKNTMINPPPNYIPYLFSTITRPADKIALKDVKVGQRVSVYTATDLRTLSNDEFVAVSINMDAVPNNISGNIMEIKGEYLTVKSDSTSFSAPSMSQPSVNKELSYTVRVTEDTEISRMKPMVNATDPNIPEKLTLSDLKTDMRVVIYTDQDITKSTNISALRIEPVAVLIPPVLAPNTPAVAVTPNPSSSAPLPTPDIVLPTKDEKSTQ